MLAQEHEVDLSQYNLAATPRLVAALKALRAFIKDEVIQDDETKGLVSLATEAIDEACCGQSIGCGDLVEVNEGPHFGLVGSVIEIAISPKGSAAAKIRLQDNTMIEVLTKWLNKVGK